MSNPTNPADGTYVVIQNGQRVTLPTPSQQEAQAEAERRNKLNEGAGQPLPEEKRAAVKQNLMG
jgi:hypothetical protein